MAYLISCFIVLFILYSVGDHVGNGDCRSTTGLESDLIWLCKRSNTITLTWGFMQGHATGDSGDRIVIKKSFPECIAICGRYGFIPTSQGDNMVTLAKK